MDGLAEIVVEASKVEMELEQAKEIITHLAGQLDSSRRSLSYNPSRQLSGSDVPPVTSTVEQRSVSANKDTPPEVNAIPRPSGSRQYCSPDRVSNEEEEGDE